MSKNLKVTIVGRTNVGKSTLFNRLSSRVKAIAFDQPGVTRDFIQDMVSWNNATFSLIDTAGLTLRKTDDSFAKELQKRGIALIESSDVIIFMCDGTTGLLPEDREIAQLLHKAGKKVIVVINKMDIKDAAEYVHEFAQFGFGEIIPISAQHGTGIGDLLESIVHALPQSGAAHEDAERVPKVAIIGKPNVGKSSLLNVLLNKERVLVADYPGTTREPISEKISFYKEDIQFTDTPGIRRKRMVDEPLETLMVKRAFSAIDDADIVLLMVDGSEHAIADQELKLAFYAFENQKALAILFNKTDLVDEESKEDLTSSLDEYKFFIKKIPSLMISCKTGKNVGRVLSMVSELWGRYTQQFANEELTILFKEALRHKPLYVNSNMLILRAAKQVKTGPITILLIVNEPKWFGDSQLKFFDNILRRAYNLSGVPVKFFVRKTG
jgi:GTP-binding protein